MKSGHLVFEEASREEIMKRFESMEVKDLERSIRIMEKVADKDSNLDVYEKHEIPVIDELKNYQLYIKNLQLFSLFTTSGSEFAAILKLIEPTKIFSIPDNVSFLLMNTKNEVRKTFFPFMYGFIDVNIAVYDRIYHGFIFMDCLLANKIAKYVYKIRPPLDDEVIIITFCEGDNGAEWLKFDLYEKGGDKYEKKLKEYIMNMTDFINSEDVKIVFNLRTKKNMKRRLERGKMAIPSHNVINVTGYLKKYLNQLEKQGNLVVSRGCSHRFWVRGFWRRFWHKKYDNLYKLFEEGKLEGRENKLYMMDGNGTLMVWILPHIKGEGMLVNKNYKLR